MYIKGMTVALYRLFLKFIILTRNSKSETCTGCILTVTKQTTKIFVSLPLLFTIPSAKLLADGLYAQITIHDYYIIPIFSEVFQS